MHSTVIAAPAGQPVLAPVFTDHMVLQRDAAQPFWGTAPTGEEVTVTLGSTIGSAFADAGGKWKITLPARTAEAQPQTVTVSVHGQVKVTLTDVLIGDVWLCAGQSNMEFRCNQESSWDTEQNSAAMPHLRLFNMGYAGQGVFGSAYSAAIVARQTPEQFYNPATWTASTAASAAPFSAVGYFFGKEILNTQNVPVGLIHCAVGGSPAEAWMRRDILPAAFTAPNWTTNNTTLEPWCNGRALVQLGSLIGTAPGDEMGPNHSFKPGSTVTLTVQHTSAAMSTSNCQPPASIELAGSDGLWQSDTATLSGQTITLASSVAAPSKVRYGWQPFSTGNAVNAAGFPLSTFQSSIAP